MQDYRNLGGGTGEDLSLHDHLHPPRPGRSGRPQSPRHRPRSTEGAMLRFNQALDLAQLGNVRFLGGELHGRVTMRSRGKSPDHPTASGWRRADVQLGEDDIAAAETVEIPLWPPLRPRPANAHPPLAPRGRTRQPSRGKHRQEWNTSGCNRSSGCIWTSAREKKPAAGAASVACRGDGGHAGGNQLPRPFPLRRSFADGRLPGSGRCLPNSSPGPGNRLTCDTLSVFTKKPGARRVRPPAAADRGDRLAHGRSSPADKLYAGAKQSQYDFSTRPNHARRDGEVLLQQGSNEIHARNLQVQVGRPGPYWQASAKGRDGFAGKMANKRGPTD